MCGPLELVIRTSHSNWSFEADLRPGHSKHWSRLVAVREADSKDCFEGLLPMTSIYGCMYI